MVSFMQRGGQGEWKMVLLTAAAAHAAACMAAPTAAIGVLQPASGHPLLSSERVRSIYSRFCILISVKQQQDGRTLGSGKRWTMTLTDYELERQRRVEENRRRMEQLGLPQVPGSRVEPSKTGRLQNQELLQPADPLSLRAGNVVNAEGAACSAGRKGVRQDVDVDRWCQQHPSNPSFLSLSPAPHLAVVVQMADDMVQAAGAEAPPKRERKKRTEAEAPLEPTRRHALVAAAPPGSSAFDALHAGRRW